MYVCIIRRVTTTIRSVEIFLGNFVRLAASIAPLRHAARILAATDIVVVVTEDLVGFWLVFVFLLLLDCRQFFVELLPCFATLSGSSRIVALSGLFGGKAFFDSGKRA